MTLKPEFPQRHRPNRLVAFRLVAGSILVLSLGGCWTLPNQLQGPLSIQLDNGAVSLAVCEEITASGIWGETTSSGQEGPFWDADSPATAGVDLANATIIDAENLEALFAEVTQNSAPSFGPDSGILVFVESIEGNEANLSAAFDLKGRTDFAGKWLHPDGSLTDEPCVK